MASVAGAVAEFVGYDLLIQTENLIIENGGDIFLKSKNKLRVSIYAGESALSYKVNLLVKPEETPLGICTSSATVGPSLSFGKADAVCVISQISNTCRRRRIRHWQSCKKQKRYKTSTGLWN